MVRTGGRRVISRRCGLSSILALTAATRPARFGQRWVVVVLALALALLLFSITMVAKTASQTIMRQEARFGVAFETCCFTVASLDAVLAACNYDSAF